jgi:hypothetical protein
MGDGYVCAQVTSCDAEMAVQPLIACITAVLRRGLQEQQSKLAAVPASAPPRRTASAGASVQGSAVPGTTNHAPPSTRATVACLNTCHWTVFVTDANHQLFHFRSSIISSANSLFSRMYRLCGRTHTGQATQRW